MFKSELHDVLFHIDVKNADDERDDSNHSDLEAHLSHKSKIETDQSSSASKNQSRSNSLAREDSLASKIQNLNINTVDLSSILWKFINERYVPYLHLLNTCNVPTESYQKGIEAFLERHFLELLHKDLKQINDYCKQNKIKPELVRVLALGVQLMLLMARNIKDYNQEWAQKNSRELETLSSIHSRISMTA